MTNPDTIDSQNFRRILTRNSLSHRGFLGLGPRESLDFSGYKDAFEPMAKAERLYRKKVQAR